MNDSPCWVLCAADDNFAEALCVTLVSMIHNVSPDAQLHLLLVDNGISPNKRARLEKVLEQVKGHHLITWKTVDEGLLSGLKPDRHITVSSYLRLFMEDFFPPEAERVCYIDSDTLVLGDVARLSHFDLEGKTVGAIQDYSISSWGHSFSSIGRSYFPTLSEDEAEKIDLAHDYFNGGIMVVDLVRWRELGIKGKAMEYALRYGHEGNCDQDAMNLALKGDWHALPLEWNVQGAVFLLEQSPDSALKTRLLEERARLLQGAQIMHFSGNIKPWQPSSHQAYASLWRDTLFGSGWFSPGEATRWRARFAAGQVRDRLLIAAGRRKVRERTH